MSRHGLASLLLLPALVLAADEPTVLGKKAAEWLAMLHKDPNVKHRQAALIALGTIGPKVPGVVPGTFVVFY